MMVDGSVQGALTSLVHFLFLLGNCRWQKYIKAGTL